MYDMSVFHQKIEETKRRLQRIRRVNGFLKVLTFGVVDLGSKIRAIETELALRTRDFEEYEVTTREYKDLKLYVEFCHIQGTSLATVGPQGPVTVKIGDYGPDWVDISEHIKRRDAFTCQEADRRCDIADTNGCRNQ